MHLNKQEKLMLMFSLENKQLKKLDKMADEIIALESKYQAMTDEELANKTNEFKEALANGKTLDDIIIDAFATVREAAYRILGLKAFKVSSSKIPLIRPIKLFLVECGAVLNGITSPL